MHTSFRVELDKSLVNGVIQCVEMMKAMEESFIKRSVTLNNFSFIMEKYYLLKVKEKLRLFKGTLTQAAQKKDSVILHLCNILEVSIFNINIGFNKSRETVVRHCIDFLKHSKKTPLQK